MAWQPVDTFVGQENLGNTLADLRRLQIQEKQQDIANRLNLAQLKAYEGKQRNLADLQNYSQSLERPVPVTRPNPSYFTPQEVASVTGGPGTMEDPNLVYNEGQELLDRPKTIEKMEPLTERQKAEKLQTFMKSRSMFEELKQYGQVEDLTTKIDAKQAAALGKAHNLGTFTYMQAKQRGMSDFEASEHANKVVRGQAPQLGLDPNDMTDTQFGASVTHEPAPDGGFFYTSFDPATGSLKVQHLAPAKGEYKDRTRTEGEKTIFEESQDGGKTWKKVSEGARHKPPAYGPGGNGKPPIGYRFTANGDLEPIPGGPADQKVTAAGKSQEGAIQAIDTAITSVKELLNHPGRKSATGFSSITNRAALPGGDAKTFLTKLDTFKSQMFVPMVQQLKGMGQLSDAEGKKLTAAVGALEPDMSEDAFVASLTQILSELESTRNRTSQPLANASTGRQPAANKPIPKGGTVRYNSKGERI